MYNIYIYIYILYIYYIYGYICEVGSGELAIYIYKISRVQYPKCPFQRVGFDS